jgi:hypothetical protein
MSPNLPISVPTIIPPSQQNGFGESSQSRYYGGNDSLDGDEGSDAYSIQSEPRHGYGYFPGNSKGGSISAASLGGVSGPRPLPPRSGSAEKIHESVKYNPLGLHESPVVWHCWNFSDGRNFTRNVLHRIMDQYDLVSQIYLPFQTPSAEQCHHLYSVGNLEGYKP